MAKWRTCLRLVNDIEVFSEAFGDFTMQNQRTLSKIADMSAIGRRGNFDFLTFAL